MFSKVYWSAGEQIFYREVWRGKVWTAKPVIVVKDDSELIVLYMMNQTPWKICAPGEGLHTLYESLKAERWQVQDTVWEYGDTLFVIRPGEEHAVHVMWGAQKREFVGWYVNLQEPARRTPIGFDFMDLDLDIVIRPDFSWQWKDEDSFRQKVDEGFYSKEEGEAIRAEGERALGRMARRQMPFDESWTGWQAPLEWEVPALRAGWDEVGLSK